MPANKPSLLEKEQLVKFTTLDRFTDEFGTEPRRLSDEPTFTYLLLYIKQGKGHFFIDNEYVPLEAGTLLMVHPFCFMHFETTSYVQGVVVLFTEEFLCRTYLYEQLLYKTIYTPNRIAFFQLKENEVGNNYIQSQMSMFGWEYRLGKDPLLKFDFLHNILLGTIIYMHKLQLERENVQLDITEPLAKSKVVQFIQLLNTHFREETSLQFYADKMNITLDQLTQLCKKGVGWAPKTMMQEKVIREAKRLLLFTQMSIKDISYDLGFTESTNFVKFFQQHTGISPKNFKVQNCIQGLSGENNVA